MELSVAIIVFLLKTGIKQLNKDYSTQSFIEDVLGAFGEETGQKISDIIKKSHYEIDNILKDQNLSKLGINNTRTDLVRTNVMEILKQIKLSNAMLSDHDCNAEEITNYIISNYADKAIISDDNALRDIKRALFEIIRIQIDIAKQDGVFISDLLINIYKYTKMNSSTLKDVKKDTSAILALLENQTRMYYEMQQQFASSRARQNEEFEVWSPQKSEASENVDSETLDALIDFSKGGQGNVKLV